MKGDFTRLTYDPVKHYSGVMQQQGRVQLDADFNEQDAIRRHDLRELARDVIGAHGGPERNLGFAVEPRASDSWDFPIAPGRYWVDGLLCVNPSTVRYGDQPDFLICDRESKLEPGTYLAYLDAWERTVNGIEDTAIVEPALNGLDTAVRVCLTWVVRVAPLFVAGGQSPGDAAAAVLARLAARDYAMEARLTPDAPDPDLSVRSLEARYRGNENRLYRVEIHDAGTEKGGATFKWSRDNGSVCFAIEALAGSVVKVRGLGRDPRRDLDVQDWVELVDDDLRRLEEARPLRRIKSIDRTAGEVELDDAFGGRSGRCATKHPFLRRWDQVERRDVKLKDGAVPIACDRWISLEDGLEIRFTAPDPATFATGDYWLVPARATGEIEWPPGAARPPHGIEHHYAPLAQITIDANGKATRQEDFRKRFAAIAIA